MTYEFKKHTIRRSCDKEYKDYHSYDKYLDKDFNHRCCYCNMFDELIKPLSFQIDHFIPIHTFEGKRDKLLTDYNNLMYACPKCNRLKSDMFEGELPDEGISNSLFYNPVEVDYNTIFYRDNDGNIMSDDEKGKETIKLLKLYRPVHQLAWFLDELGITYCEVEERLQVEKDPIKKAKLQAIYEKLGNVLHKKERTFRNSY